MGTETESPIAAADAEDPLFGLFKRYARPYWPQFGLGMGAGVGQQVANRVPELVVGVAFDAVLIGTAAYDLPLVPDGWVPNTRTAQFRFTVGILVAAYLVGVLFQVVTRLSSMWASQRLLHDLRTDAYDAMQRQSLAYFDDAETGQLISVLNNDIQNLQSFVGALNGVVQFPVSVAVAFAFMALLNWQLALVLLFAPALIAVFSYWYQRRVEPIYEDLRERIGSLNAQFENNVSGIQTIKAYTAEAAEAGRVREVADDRRETELDQKKYESGMAPLTHGVENLAVVVIVVFGGFWVLNGPPGPFTASLTPGMVLTFVLYTRSFVQPMRQIPQIIDGYENARASARRVASLTDAPSRIDDPENPVPLGDVAGRVEYDDVRFSYEGTSSTGEGTSEETSVTSGEGVGPDGEADETIRGVSFSVEPGETVGIVGRTGAGKSTLLKLLFRFFDVDGGAVRVDGIDVRDVRRRDLRSHLGYVEQEPFLFYGTVRENITYAVDGATDEAVRAAAERAGAHEFVADLPDGYDTEIGERGVKLSGGQRQRIAIARAILGDPAVLVLDEATSHVDNRTEAVIQEHLDRLTADRTTFVIAHRLSTVRDADRILVMDDGAVVERGTHEELLAAEGLYADLWRVQVGEVSDLSEEFVERARRRQRGTAGVSSDDRGEGGSER